MRTTIKPYPQLISLLFITLEMIFTLYQLIRLFFHTAERKNWAPFCLLLCLLLYNGTLGWIGDWFRLLVVNLLGLMAVALTMLLPLFRLSKIGLNLSQSKESSPKSKESFLENCRKFNFSVREIEVADLVCRGFKNKQIAKELFISEKTVETHLQNIYAKIGDRGKVALINKLNQS